ncbi:hypothetical protein RP20_CCG018741 [Aedes albopictus]|nr:hypothetical protein RP20_CCG018741 [Aedes albopictus]
MMNAPGNSQQVGDGAAAQRVHSSTSLPSIERLVGRENWPTWKFAVQTFLELEDLWEAVKPTPNADGTDPAVDPLKDRRARGKIILLLDPVNYVHVREAKTAKEAWSKLESAFEDTGLTRKVGLLRKLITASLATNGSMETYVNTIVATAHQLRGIGFDISEEWIGTLLLAGLPEEYRPMVMALENSGTAITGDIVKTKLLQEVRVSSSSSSAAGAAFSSNKHHGRKPKQADPPPQGKGPKCRRCQKYGHIARECPQKEPRNGNAWCTVLSAISEDDGNWYFDSGASNHFSRTESSLENVRRHGGTVVAANRGSMEVVAKGSMKLRPECCPEDPPIEVHEVHVIPELSANLLSVNQIVQRGHTVTFTTDGVTVKNPEGHIIATGSRTNGLFKLDQLPPTKALACAPVVTADLWHRRMGHINLNSVQRLRGGLVSGLEFSDVAKKDENCRICALGKLSRLPFSNVGSRATELLELVHSDICGPMETDSLGGSRYYLTFIDDKSRRISVYFLAEKSAENVFKAFEDFRRSAERQTGKKLKVLRTDNGKEFTNKLLGDHLKRLGVRHQTSVDYTPEQNGLAERVNRTIVERARCMLYEANLPKSFWAEAAATAVYLVNRSPTKGHDKTPEEMWSGKKPSLAHVRVFGSSVMAHIPKQKRKKWDAKAHECILTGFDEDTKAYRLWDPKAKQVIKRRDVSFIREGGAAQAASNVKPTEARTTIRLDLDGEFPWEPAACERAPTEQGSTEQATATPFDEDDSNTAIPWVLFQMTL